MSAENNNDGGPAFPSDRFGEGGMSLRDYFAGQALAGLIACPNTSGDEEPFACNAYKFADAMLTEREKRKGGDA